MRLLRIQLHNSSGSVRTRCISSIGRAWPSCRPSFKSRSPAPFSIIRNAHPRTSSRPYCQHRRCVESYVSCHVWGRSQARHQSTATPVDSSTSDNHVGGEQDIEELDNGHTPQAVAAEPSILSDGAEEGEQAGELYTGLFDEPTPTQAGKEVLENSPISHHLELLNLTVFSERTRQRLSKPGRVLRFNTSPIWDTLLPIIAEKLGLHHIMIKKGHPYFKCVAQSKALHALVNSTDRSPEAEPERVSQPLENILLDHISPDIIGHWLQEFRKLDEVPPSYLMKLMMFAHKYNLSAVPIMEITRNDRSAVEESASNKSISHSYRLKITNEAQNILIIKDIETSSPITFKVLADALMEYIESLCKTMPSNTSVPFHIARSRWDPARHLSKAVKILGWGTYTLEDTPVHQTFGDLSRLDLWKCQVITAKKGPLGPAVMWGSKRFARRMAALYAFDLLKDDLKAGYASGRLTAAEYSEFAELWGERVSGFEQGKQKTHLIPSAQPPISHEIRINEEIVHTMVSALRNLMRCGFQSVSETSPSLADLELDSLRRRPSLAKAPRLDDILYRNHRDREFLPARQPRNLPVRDPKICLNIIKAIETSDITIITAATGSGKTTQVPQMILDEYITTKNGSMCNIVCTQPRRVSTVSVATRVAFERHQSIGQEVGYKIRFDIRPVQVYRGITYMTSGYLLRLLESDPLGILQDHSHIILDEVHTRDVDTDLLLTAMKNVFEKRVLVELPKMPKIILMSATINAGFFKSYFEDLESQIKISALDVPGRMFNVEDKRLEQVLMELQESHPHVLNALLENSEVRNYINGQNQETISKENENHDEEPAAELQENEPVDEIPSIPPDLVVPTSLVHLLIVQIMSSTASGDILVFLPGLAEIETIEHLLLNDPLSRSAFDIPYRYKIFKLHSALYETNYEVFEPISAGCRRIILATNIAETSITLPDVESVIDTGLSRQVTFDQITQSSIFGLQWISKAEAVQRKGRAGRTRAGICYATYSQAQYDAMASVPTPEILKMTLDQLVLRHASSAVFRLLDRDLQVGDGSEDVLAGQALLAAPSPPERRFVAAAARQVHNIRALTVEGDTTPMGKILSRLPMTPAAGKAVLLGLIFRCLDPMVLYGAVREDFVIMFDPIAVSGVVERRKILAGIHDDDRWADSRAFFHYDRLKRRQDHDAANELRGFLALRHDAYCEYAQISKQTFETLGPLLGLPEVDEDSRRTKSTPLFPVTPELLNTNSDNANLIKALAFSTQGSRFACWCHKHWRGQNHPRLLAHPKSVNHASSKRVNAANRMRREGGDLLSYSAMRIIPKDKYPWLHETATVSPVMAILFAESVSLVEAESTFVVNGWVKYRLTSDVEGVDTKRSAKVIWEYRKALDRFLIHAMQMISLEPHKIKKVKDGKLSINDFNKFFREEKNEFRELFVNSVTKILGIDAKDRADRLEVRKLEEGVSEEQALVDDASREDEEADKSESESEFVDEEEHEDGEGYPSLQLIKSANKNQQKYVPAAPKKKKEDSVQKRLQELVKSVMLAREKREEGE